MSLQMLKMRKLEDRLMFLKRFLTKPGLDERIDHYHRQKLLEEAEELEVQLKVPVRTEYIENEFA